MVLLRPFRSLSARLLVLTMVVATVAELAIYLPLLARHRVTYLTDLMARAHIAAVAADPAPSEAQERRLLGHVEAHGAKLEIEGRTIWLLGGRIPPMVDAYVMLDEASPFDLVGDALATLFRRDNRVLHIRGASPCQEGAVVELILDEKPLREAMIAYSWRMALLSLAISALTAAALFLSLRRMMIRPMTGLVRKWRHFAEEPGDSRRILEPSGRQDEIGGAERAFAEMQRLIHYAFGQRARLAAVGEGVTKISHDLRNMLASAQLISQSLVESSDPRVQKAAPTLAGALDRAADFCRRVSEFARAGASSRREPQDVPLAGLLDEAARGHLRSARWVNRVAPGLRVAGDRGQLLRVFANLLCNAEEAGGRAIEASATLEDGRLQVTIADDGPGLSERARESLFRAFHGSTKPNGSGLGLAIADEIMQAHGGSIRLLSSDATGTAFRLDFAPGGGRE